MILISINNQEKHVMFPNFYVYISACDWSSTDNKDLIEIILNSHENLSIKKRIE